MSEGDAEAADELDLCCQYRHGLQLFHSSVRLFANLIRAYEHELGMEHLHTPEKLCERRDDYEKIVLQYSASTDLLTEHLETWSDFSAMSNSLKGDVDSFTKRLHAILCVLDTRMSNTYGQCQAARLVGALSMPSEADCRQALREARSLMTQFCDALDAHVQSIDWLLTGIHSRLNVLRQRITDGIMARGLTTDGS